MKKIAIAVAGAALLLAASGPARAVLVLNGGFETGDFSGWTAAGDQLTIDTTFVVSGGFDASFGQDGNSLSQPIATVPGTAYTLAFSLLDEGGSNADTFTVAFGGFSATITGDTTPDWTAESFLVPGGDITDASATLTLLGVNVGAAWNLDDVFVTEAGAAIPEPPIGLLALAASVPGMMLWRYRRRA